MPDNILLFIRQKKMKRIIGLFLLLIFSLSIILTFTGCTPGVISGLENESTRPPEKLTAPWGDHEEIIYVSTKDGVKTDYSKYIIGVEVNEDKKCYKIEKEVYIKDGKYTSGALLDYSDLTPVSSHLEQNIIKDGKPKIIKVKGKYNDTLLINSNVDGVTKTSKVNLPIQFFDSEYLAMAIREFSLNENFSTEMKICSTSAGNIATLSVSVVGKEKVKVPYGEFDCYKLALSSKEKKNNGALFFWVSADNKRNLIKYGQNDNYIELKSVKY